MADQKSSPSKMIRVPTVLIAVVRKLSKLHRQGHTIALLQELEEVISKFDSENDIVEEATRYANNFANPSKSLKQLEERLSQLESQLADRDKLLSKKLEAIGQSLEQLSRSASVTGRNNYTKRRSNSYYPYQQPMVELGPFPHDNLAQRLGLNPASLLTQREKLSTKEFISYTRNRDPRSFGWEYRSDNLYHPVPQ